MDENGKPLVVYHGTNVGFDVFDDAKTGSNTHNNGFFGTGFYFTDNKTVAKQYSEFSKNKSGIVMEEYIDIKNPFYWNNIRSKTDLQTVEKDLGLKKGTLKWTQGYAPYAISRFENNADAQVFSRALKNAGYDGIVFEYDVNNHEYVVFDNMQMKSATDNIGSYNSGDSNTRFSTRDGNELSDGQKKLAETGEEYLDAVESGDMETAQRMVEEAFKPSTDVITAFSNTIDNWLSGNMKSSEYFELGETPAVLKELGAKDLPVIMSQDVIVKITGGKHSISLDEIKRLPEAIHDPIMVFSSATVPNAFVLITEFYDKSGNSVIAALHLNKKQDRLSVNRIASVYGKGSIANFVETQSELGNLRYIDKEKSQQWSTSRGLQLPKLVQSITDNDSILQKEDIVNSILFENDENDSGNVQKNVAETDKEYLDAVESGDMETAQRMVDEAAKEAGYDSPLLYHGTESFGFTEFDLTKADDGRSIFLTSNEEIASTYSGVKGKRNISDIYTADVESMSSSELVNALNDATERYGSLDDDDRNSYSYYDYGKVNRLINEVNTGLEELKPIVDEKISEYAERMSTDFDEKDAKIHGQLVDLKNKLDKWEYDGLSTPIYMLLHHTDVFSDINNVKKIAELEKNIRLMNRVRSSKNLDEGVIVSESLGGYYLNTLSRDMAIRKLRSIVGVGNYSMYAKTEKPLIIDAHGELWNSIYGWSDEMVPGAGDVEVIKEGDEYRLKDNNTGEYIEDAVIDVNEATLSMTDEERKTFILNKIRDMWSIRTENIKTTRGIAKYAKEHGYGSVIIKNLVDNGGNNPNVDPDTKADIYILFDSNNAKSADPVTYDDNGNVIPLSERFNSENNDVRYQRRNKKITAEDVEKFDYSLYNEIELPFAERERVQSEVLTWHADKRNQLISQTLSNGTTYHCVIDDEGIVYVYNAEPSTNIHERKTKYDNTDRERPDRFIEKLRAGQRYNGGNFDFGENGRKPSETNTDDNFSLRREKRGQRTRYSKNATYDNRKPKEYKFNDDGTAEITYSDGTKTRYSLRDDGMWDFDDVWRELVEEYGALYPENLKSAKTVTYDDKGDVIPLSERFNPENEDIRYQGRSVDNQFNGEYNGDEETSKEGLYDEENKTGRHSLVGRRGRSDIQDSREQSGGIFGKAGSLTERTRRDRQITAKEIRDKLLTKLSIL